MMQQRTPHGLRTCAGVKTGDSLNAASRKSQVSSIGRSPFKFAKAALPSRRHSRKPAHFEFTRHVRRHADTVFGHLFCRTTVSQGEFKKGKYRLSGGRGYAPE
jgi:hypothetical protein